jgi:catechol 2,3-dioxygenase-like lactoylglutathione lyase family enzyme
MLGYELLQEGASPDGSVRLLLLGRGDHLLEIVQRDGAEDPPPLPDASYRLGIFKLGFVTCDIEALEAEMRRKGADFSHGLVQPPGNPWRTFAVRDPDGNLVQLFGP